MTRVLWENQPANQTNQQLHLKRHNWRFSVCVAGAAFVTSPEVPPALSTRGGHFWNLIGCPEVARDERYSDDSEVTSVQLGGA